MLVAPLAPAVRQHMVTLSARDRMITVRPTVVYTGRRAEGLNEEMSYRIRRLAFDAFAEFMSVIAFIRTDAAAASASSAAIPTAPNAAPSISSTPPAVTPATLPPQPAPLAFSRSGLAAYTIIDDLGIERVAVRRLPASWK